jgi:hypothetical protein
MRRSFLSLMAVVFIFSFASSSLASVDSIYEVAIVNMKGDVQVDTNGDGTWIRPWVGMKLMEKAIIKTGSNSNVDIVFDVEGLNLVRVRENSITTVGKALLDLPDGSVFAKFANLQPGSSFTVKTPTAACAIRGSVMIVGVSDVGTEVMAFDGPIFVVDASGVERTIPEGFKASVGPGGVLGEIEPLAAADWAEHNEAESGTGGGTGEGTGGSGDDEDGEVDTKDLDEVREISPSS